MTTTAINQLVDKIMATIMPKYPSNDTSIDEQTRRNKNFKREETRKAIKQLHEDLAYLSNQDSEQINQLVQDFAQAFHDRQFQKGDTQIKLATLFDKSVVDDFLKDKGVDLEPAEGIHDTYKHDLTGNKAVRQKLDRQRRHDPSTFKTSFQEIFDITAYVMQKCRQQHRLSYHTIWHALMVSNMSRINAKDHKLDEEWSLLTSMLGLMHDVVFRRQTGPDEMDSAELFLNTNQFYKQLPEQQQQIFAALTRVILSFGTLPLVHAQNEQTSDTVGFEKPKFDTMKMQSCIEVYLQHDPSFASMPILTNILTAARSIARADIHGSLNPQGFLDQFPSSDYEITKGLSASTDKGSLLSFINDYYDSNHPNIRTANYEQFKTCALLKFIQGVSYITENCSSDPNESHSQQLATQIKIDQIINSTADVKLDEQDLKVIAGDPDDLKNQPGLIAGEFFFAKMQYRGSCPTDDPIALAASPELANFFPESWQWHHDLYHNMRQFMLDTNNDLDSRLRCAQDLLTLTSNQPGCQFDLAQFEQKFKTKSRSLEIQSHLTESSIQSQNGASATEQSVVSISDIQPGCCGLSIFGRGKSKKRVAPEESYQATSDANYSEIADQKPTKSSRR